MSLLDGPKVLGYKLKLDGVAAFTGDMGKARHELRQTKTEGSQAALGIKQFGAAMATAAVSLAGAYVGLRTVTKALDAAFEGTKALGKFSTIFQGDSRALARFSDQIDETARKVGVSDDALLGHAEKVLRAGFDQRDAMGIVESSAKVSQAAYEDLGQVITATTNALNTYQLGAADTTRVQNAMFLALRRGAGTFGDLGEFIGRRGSGLKNAVSMEETLAMAATLGQSGIVGGRALQSIQMVMDQLIGPSDSAKETARELGIEWDFAAMKAQGFGAWIARLGSRLKELDRQGVSTGEVLKKLGIESQAQSTMSALTDNAEKYQDILAEIQRGHDALTPLQDTWKDSPQAMRDRIKAVNEQQYEALGTGMLAGFTGQDTDAVVNRLAETLPKLTEAGESLGRAGKMLLDFAIESSGGKEGEGVNWLKWGVLGGGAALAAPKVLQAGRAVAGAGSWLGGMSNAAQTIRGIGSAAAFLPEMFRMQPGLYLSNEDMQRIYEGGARGRPEQVAFEAHAFAAAAPFMPIADQHLGRVQEAWREMIGAAIKATDSEAARQAMTRSLESIERTWADKWAEMSRRLAESSAENFIDMSIDQILAGHSRPGQEPQQSLHVYLDHTMTDKTKDGKNHRARAKVSGAGRAEINQQYRFFIARDGEGVNEVRPLPRDVAFAHVRPGYDG